MASWSDLPTELNLLIVNDYIESILTEFDEGHGTYPITYALYQIMNLPTALPFLHPEVLECVDVLWAPYRDRYISIWEGSEKPIKEEEEAFMKRFNILLMVGIKLEKHWGTQYWWHIESGLRYSTGEITKPLRGELRSQHKMVMNTCTGNLKICRSRVDLFPIRGVRQKASPVGWGFEDQSEERDEKEVVFRTYDSTNQEQLWL